jgi:hypothetical protein
VCVYVCMCVCVCKCLTREVPQAHGVYEMSHDVPFPPLGAAVFQEYYDTPTYQVNPKP